ncbi:hypothetical protein C4D60_Mb04t21330 [Musa balbisiana]|uniref:Uncharacterized protein n=1 Tax=Musa balbisiana TaxID=52838 RepID=A0A4S8KDP2_MUSBA|nr:hypothetical protein C4D60_Mb04t21330 [Musa balbisiana]
MLMSAPVVLGKSNMPGDGREIEIERGHNDVKLTATGFEIGRKKELQEGE